jgi:hypothetical protein
MKAEIVRAAVDEIKDDRGLVLLPQGFGETMLHPDWHELVGYAIEQGIRPIVMLSNGTKLTEENARHLLRLEVDALVLSIDGTEAETYEKIRVGAKLEEVEANVRRLIELRGDRPRPRLFLRIIRMRETADQIEPFFERWQPLLGDGDEILVNEYNDWAGKVEDRRVEGAEPSSSPADRRPPCRMLWRNLSVQSDGRVSGMPGNHTDRKIDNQLFPVDGIEGRATAPFVSMPDAAGRTAPFAIAWTGGFDVAGGVLARADGYNSELLRTEYGGVLHNRDVYWLIHRTLFGEQRMVRRDGD